MQLRYILLSVYIFLTIVVTAQDVVTTTSLTVCIEQAMINYPLAAQREVIDKTSEASIEKINAAWQPQVALNGQASYQSDVPFIPGESPYFAFPILRKDQYKVELGVTQLIYDGGNISQAKSLQAIDNATQKYQLETDLYKVKQQVIQLYANILLATDNLELIANTLKTLNDRKQDLLNGQANGVVTQLSINVLEAEIIKTRQQQTETINTKQAAMKMLAGYTGESLSSNTNFQKPEITIVEEDNSITRPEIDLFKTQSEFTTQQKEFASGINLPQVSLFATGGYGLPGPNFFLTQFDAYYMAGIKFNYPLWQGNIKKTDAAIYTLQNETIANQQKTFELNTRIDSEQKMADITKYNQLIELDKQIIVLKKEIMNATDVQLKNGVITSTDYVVELNGLLQVQQNQALHETQLLIAKTNYLITLGKL
ncbi:MAG: TolC family protein [Bacteroidetes bacterium]|nr:TolC family protein [Bacteroidota bacterium]